MTRIYAPLCAVALLLLSAPGCSWFSKHPVIPAVVTCSGQTIPIQLVEQVYGDVMAENWIDLATNVVPLLKDGYADIVCIMNYLSVSNPETVPHIEKLKAAHVEMRGGSACNNFRSPQSLQVAAGPRPAASGKFSYLGENVRTAADRCDRACGTREAIGSPGGPCLCQRRIGGKLSWLAAR